MVIERILSNYCKVSAYLPEYLVTSILQIMALCKNTAKILNDKARRLHKSVSSIRIYYDRQNHAVQFSNKFSSIVIMLPYAIYKKYDEQIPKIIWDLLWQMRVRVEEEGDVGREARLGISW